MFSIGAPTVVKKYYSRFFKFFQMPQESYFLSTEKYRPVLFGLPLIVACSESTTYLDLVIYCANVSALWDIHK